MRVDPEHQQCPPLDLSSSYYVGSCTGCYESEDGHPCGDYPIHPVYGCHIGAGCDECDGEGIRERLQIYPYMDLEETRLIEAGLF